MRILILISFLVIISTSSTTAHALCFHNHEQSNKRQTKATNPYRRSAAYPTSWLNNARRGGSIVCRKNNDPVAQTFLGESNMSGERDKQTNPPPMFPGGTIIIGWVAAMSIFIVKNYASTDLWPTPQLAEIPIPYLSLIHNLSNMVFSGSIITTTIIEWIVTDSNDFKIISFWFDRIQRVERFLVLPALFLSVVSGIIRANVTYGTSLMDSPLHIKSSLHLLATFGLWWGITDRTTINRVSSLVEGEEDDEKVNTTCNTTTNTRSKEGNVDVVQEVQIPFNKRLVKIRRISNIISCGFLVASYAMMTLKPGLSNY